MLRAGISAQSNTMAAMASQHPVSIPHNSDTDTVSVSSELDTHRQHTLPILPPAAIAATPVAASIQLDDELDSLVDDQFHHRFPEYHDHHRHASHSQTHHDNRYSTNGSSASRTPSYRRSRFKSIESNASAATSLYSSRSSHPPRTSSLSQSSSSVPPLFASTARASASPIKRKPLSTTASSLATAFQRSSTASSTAASSVATPVVPPLPHGAANATATATTTPVTARSLESHGISQETTRPPTAVSSHIIDLPEPDTRFARPPSVDSPTLYHFPPARPIEHPPSFQ